MGSKTPDLRRDGLKCAHFLLVKLFNCSTFPAGATDLSSVQGNNTHDELGKCLLCVTNEAEGRPACVSVCPLACQYFSVCSARA